MDTDGSIDIFKLSDIKKIINHETAEEVSQITHQLPKKDKKGKQITLDDRLDVIHEMLPSAPGEKYENCTAIEKYFIDFFDTYGNAKLNVNNKAFQKYLSKGFNTIEEMADYLIFINIGISKLYNILSSRTLRRRTSKEDALSEVNINDILKNGAYKECFDDIERNIFLDELFNHESNDKIIKAINLFSDAFTQMEVADTLNITRSKLRTIIKNLKLEYKRIISA
jgi:hypothetical protein